MALRAPKMRVTPSTFLGRHNQSLLREALPSKVARPCRCTAENYQMPSIKSRTSKIWFQPRDTYARTALPPTQVQDHRGLPQSFRLPITPLWWDKRLKTKREFRRLLTTPAPLLEHLKEVVLQALIKAVWMHTSAFKDCESAATTRQDPLNRAKNLKTLLRIVLKNLRL